MLEKNSGARVRKFLVSCLYLCKISKSSLFWRSGASVICFFLKGFVMKSLLYGMFVVLGLTAGVCYCAPEPAIVQGAGDWTVDVTFEPPRQIMVEGDPASSGAVSKLERFWYIIIRLNNKTGRDVEFYPSAELMTDTFQVLAAGERTPERVFDEIKLRHQKAHPFLESLEKSGNRILQGNDNAKDIAIIWPDFEAEAKNIKFFIAGVSNETVAVEHPTAKDETGKPKKVFLRKTLEMNYDVGGDAALRSDARLTFKGNRWVMR